MSADVNNDSESVKGEAAATPAGGEGLSNNDDTKNGRGAMMNKGGMETLSLVLAALAIPVYSRDDNFDDTNNSFVGNRAAASAVASVVVHKQQNHHYDEQSIHGWPRVVVFIKFGTSGQQLALGLSHCCQLGAKF